MARGEPETLTVIVTRAGGPAAVPARVWWTLSAVALASLALCGCPPEGTGGARFGTTQANPDSRRTAGGTDAAPLLADSRRATSTGRLELRFEVLRVQVPRGTISDSEKIWNHIDEDVLPFELSRQLRRNGLRVGLGREGSWPAIRAILETTPGTLTLANSVQTRDLSPLSVQLKDCPREQTIFLYRADDSLTGATYPPGQLLVRHEPTLEPDDLSQISLRVVPELRSDSVELRWQITSAGPRQVPVPLGKAFDEVAFAVRLPAGHFLFIGPSQRIDRRYIVGAAFLADEVERRPTEWALFVTPTVVQTGLK